MKKKTNDVSWYDSIKKVIIIIGIGFATYGGINYNDTLILIGGILAIAGTLMLVILK